MLKEMLIQIESEIKSCNNHKLSSVEDQLFRFKKESVSNLASSIIDFGIQTIQKEKYNRKMITANQLKSGAKSF